MTKSFIEQQQELARNELAKNCTQYGGSETEPTKLRTDQVLGVVDTLITQIITHTGEELMRRAEGEIMCDEDCPCDYRWAINDIKQHITNVTGVE